MADDKESIEAMFLIWDKLIKFYNSLKIICETSCALSLAVILKNKEFFKDKNVCIFLSGFFI